MELIIFMETMIKSMYMISPYFLHITLFCVSLSFLYLVLRRSNASKADSSCPLLPPGKSGWPILGESFDFLSAGRDGCPEKFVSDRTSNYSIDVFRTSLMGQDIAFFSGALGNKFIFSGDNKYWKLWWPISMTKALLFPETLKEYAKDTTKVRSTLPDYLKPEALLHYIPIMDSMAKEHLAREWSSPDGKVSGLRSAKDFTVDLGCRLFMNINDTRQSREISTLAAKMTPGLTSVPINVPGTSFNKAVEGGKTLRAMIIDMIRKRKAEIARGEEENARDFLTRFLKESDDTEMEISNKMIGLHFASYDTTSSAIIAILNFLALYPNIYDHVYQEQKEIAKSKRKGETLTWEDIQKMKYSWNVANESMRLYPPAPGAFREAVHDLSFAGFTIPKGWKAFWTPYATHKNPKYFPDPEKFDPSRFEGSGPQPYTFVPFGGGPRMCMGKEYARMAILAFMHNLVMTFKFEKADPNEKLSYNPSLVAANGLLLRFTRH